MHRTESLDYAVVLEGEVTMLLDDQDVLLKAGDVVIQRGTNHAWSNRSRKTVRMLYVLSDGRFDSELAAKFGIFQKVQITLHPRKNALLLTACGIMQGFWFWRSVATLSRLTKRDK